MSLSLPHLSVARSATAAVLALAYTTLTFGATLAPQTAQAGDIFYRAELVAPAAEARAVAGGVAWFCKGTTCVAGKGTSRPVRVCRSLAKEVGSVASFTAKGEALDDAALANCNGD